MSENLLISIIKDAIYTGLLVASPILLVSIVIGLIISIFQATTQIQEQTLTFVPKLIGVALVGLLAGNWMLHTIIAFVTRTFNQIAIVTK